MLFQRTFILLAPSLSAWPLPKSLQATEVTPLLLPLLHQNSCNQGGLWWSSFCWILCSHGWTVKKAECRRIDAFELWCWRRLLRVPWTARRSNQSILKEISSEYSLEGLLLKLETPILWPPEAKNWLIWKDPDAGKDWRQEEKGMTRGWDGWMASPTWWAWVWASSRSWWWTGKPGLLKSMELQRVGQTERLKWTELRQRQCPYSTLKQLQKVDLRPSASHKNMGVKSLTGEWDKREGCRTLTLKEWHSPRTWYKLIRTK